jgi:hypothetical protein
MNALFKKACIITTLVLFCNKKEKNERLVLFLHYKLGLIGKVVNLNNIIIVNYKDFLKWL